CFQSDRNTYALAITHHAESYFVAWTLCADGCLELAGVVHLPAVEFSNHVTHFEPGSGRRRISFNLADQCASRIFQMEESRVFRRYIVNANPTRAVSNFTS